MQRAVLGMVLPFVAAQEWPMSTMNGGIAVVQAPMTTAAPAAYHEILRRQEATSLCGYVHGNGSNPLTCADAGICGWNTGYSAFGCCTATAGESLLGCNLVTKCYDSSEFSECGQACQSNTMNAWCTSSAFPFCRKYTTGIFSGFDCYSEPGEVDPVLPTPIPGYSTLDFSSSESATDISSRVSAAESGQSVGNDVAVSATPFTQTQATATSGGAASATTATDSGAAPIGMRRCLAAVVLLWPIFVTF